MRMPNDDVANFFTENDLQIPQRSVCNACFANGTQTLRDMYTNRRNDWAQAVRVDEAVRDWTQIGINKPVYVSKTLIPLRELGISFENEDAENFENVYSCDSGYCFL